MALAARNLFTTSNQLESVKNDLKNEIRAPAPYRYLFPCPAPRGLCRWKLLAPYTVEGHRFRNRRIFLYADARHNGVCRVVWHRRKVVKADGSGHGN
jgi:hypothetical protein